MTTIAILLICWMLGCSHLAVYLLGKSHAYKAVMQWEIEQMVDDTIGKDIKK